MIYITAVHMEPPGEHHGHIGAVKWEEADGSDSGESTVAEMIEWIGGRTDFAYVRRDGEPDVEVHVIDGETGRRYIRTNADGEYTDNLLYLSKF